MSRSRSAEATIKGFNYQFDASIQLLLDADLHDEATVEGIEDVDVSDGNSVKAVQCKYYEGTSLTNSTLREIVKPMIEDDQARTSKITYFIYGYFRTKNEFPLDDTARFKAEVLTYTKTINGKKVVNNIADELNLSAAELESFLGRLKFTYTRKYGPHKDAVIDSLRDEMNCSLDEAKSLYYPNAFAFVAELATKSTAAARTITKERLLAEIDAKQVIFHHWLLKEKEDVVFCRTMRRNFFTHTNISPYARFFIIECSGSESVHELKEVLLTICRKWSSHRKQRLKPRDRFAPYVLLRNCGSAKLTTLKTELYDTGESFVDGYPFRGSTFTQDHIHSDQTNEFRVSLRILTDENELQSAISSMTDRTREVYQFFSGGRLTIQEDIKHVQIPITSVTMVTSII